MAEEHPKPEQEPINDLPNTPKEAAGSSKRNKQAYEEMEPTQKTDDGSIPLHKGGSKGHRFN
jgi:hypothetical protein